MGAFGGWWVESMGGRQAGCQNALRPALPLPRPACQPCRPYQVKVFGCVFMLESQARHISSGVVSSSAARVGAGRRQG